MTEVRGAVANAPTEQADKEIARLLKQATQGDKAACDQLYARLETEGTLHSFVQSLTNTGLQLREKLHSNIKSGGSVVIALLPF